MNDDLISRAAAIDAAIEAVDELDGGYNLTRADMIADAINNTVPSAQPDTYEALRILDAINSSGRLDYGDYCDLHDAISEIGGAQNG